MTVDEKKRIELGIKAYSREQEIIKRTICKYKKLSDVEFDRIFGDITKVIKPDGNVVLQIKPIRFRYFLPGNRNAFLLGSMWPLGDWTKWLELIQLMGGLGIIKVTEEGDRYFYQIAG